MSVHNQNRKHKTGGRVLAAGTAAAAAPPSAASTSPPRRPLGRSPLLRRPRAHLLALWRPLLRAHLLALLALAGHVVSEQNMGLVQIPGAAGAPVHNMGLVVSG